MSASINFSQVLIDMDGSPIEDSAKQKRDDSGQAGQQDRRFDLCRRDRQFIFDRQEISADDLEWSKQIIVYNGSFDARPHQPQRLGDPPHRPFGDRFIARYFDFKILPSQDAGN